MQRQQRRSRAAARLSLLTSPPSVALVGSRHGVQRQPAPQQGGRHLVRRRPERQAVAVNVHRRSCGVVADAAAAQHVHLQEWAGFGDQA